MPGYIQVLPRHRQVSLPGPGALASIGPGVATPLLL